MVDCLNAEYGAGSVVCKMEDVYCNMKEYIMPVYEIIERAENAMRAAGIEPHLVPVRGLSLIHILIIVKKLWEYGRECWE